MTYFCEYQIMQNSQRATILYANPIWMPDNARENFCFGNPVCWDDIILQRIEYGTYCAYCIDFYYVPAEKCSRITDYKGIWGLRHLPRGIFETTFAYSLGKIYCGVSALGNADAFRQCFAPVVLFAKSGSFPTMESLQAAFKVACRPDFSEKDCDALENALADITDIVFLRYWMDNCKTALCVIGDTSLFINEDLYKWSGTASSIHPRYFI